MYNYINGMVLSVPYNYLPYNFYHQNFFNFNSELDGTLGCAIYPKVPSNYGLKLSYILWVYVYMLLEFGPNEMGLNLYDL